MSGPVSPPLTVKEADGTPSGRPINTIVVSNGDLSISGTTATIDTTGGGGGSATLTDTQVGFGSATNTLTGSSLFTYDDTAGSELLTISGSGNSDLVKLVSTDASASSAPDLVMYRNSASVANNDFVGRLDFRGVNAGGSDVDYGIISTRITDATNGYGRIVFFAGTGDAVNLDNAQLMVNRATVVVNEAQNDIDFKVEGASSANLLRTNAGVDGVGVNCNPQEGSRLEVDSGSNFDPTTSTLADMANSILIQGDGATSGEGNYGGGIAFTGVGSGRRRAAIAAVQTTSDVDEVGLSFFTHDASSPSTDESVQEHMRLDDSGKLFLSGDDIGTDDAGGRLHVRRSALNTEPTVLIQSTATPDTSTFATNLTFEATGTPTANGSLLGKIDFKGDDSGGGVHTYASMEVTMADKGAGTEDGIIKFFAVDGGTDASEHLTIGNGAVRVNDGGQADVDFRVEGSGRTYAFFVDATNGFVGINESAPEVPLEITDDGTNTTLLQLQSTDGDANVGPRIALWRNSPSPVDGDNLGSIIFFGEDSAGNRQEFGNFFMDGDSVTSGAINGSFRFNVKLLGSSREALRIRGSEVVVNELSTDIDFRVESDSNAYCFQVDAGNSGIGVNGIFDTTIKSDPPFQILNQSRPASYAYQAASGTSPETLTNDDLQGPLYQHISSSAHTYQLPESGVKGQQFEFFSSDGAITISPGTNDKINGGSAGADATFSTNYQIYRCICYVDNEWVVSPPT